MNLAYKILDEDNYLIFDKKDETKKYGTFRLTLVLPPNPDYGKHMDLHIYQDISEKIIHNGEVNLLLDIYQFVFDSVLEITHEKNGADLCKLYSNNELVSMVYHSFSDALEQKNKNLYEIKRYRNWIEIRKK
ncbi:MAG: hypothetical protein K0U19_01675 [Proteobacteria bacterium]|nr:hypothetical protein [Pseudomonadota bacterium]